jgi:hypothetical protein
MVEDDNAIFYDQEKMVEQRPRQKKKFAVYYYVLYSRCMVQAIK